MIDPNSPLPPESRRDVDLTECISQLAARAEELGEKYTSTVLHTLAAHRIVGCDVAMAYTAVEQAKFLQVTLLSQLLQNPPTDPTENKES